MQAWIPVVSSNLYFWNSLQLSGRGYFEIRWGIYVKLKVSWLRAFLWCMSQTSRDWSNSRHVRTHEKNSGETVRRLGTIIIHFLCPIRSQHPLKCLEIVRWVSVPRGSFAHTWKLSSRPFSRPDWLPVGLRGWVSPFSVLSQFVIIIALCNTCRNL